MRFILSLTLAAFFLPSLAFGDSQKLCVLTLRQLRSTQLFLGMQAVDKLTDRMKGRGFYDIENAVLWKKHLQNNPARVVKGPLDPKNKQSFYFIVNGNHHTEAVDRIQALQGLTWSERWVYAEQILDLSHLSWGNFWKTMNQKNFLLLLNQRGNPTSFKSFKRDGLLDVLLDTPISGLMNDSGRSMAEHLLDKGLIKRPNGQPYWQFKWAVELRKLWRSKKIDPLKDSKKAEDAAEAFAQSDDAKDLPGFKTQED